MPEIPLKAGPWHRLGILVSGKGSNMAAVLSALEQGQLEGQVAAVISDQRDCPALELARQHGVKTAFFPIKAYGSRSERDAAMATYLNELAVDLVLTLGYMKILDSSFLSGVTAPVLNIHPSLLPSFKGMHAVEQALAAGVCLSGCTFHFVVPEVDAGPILAQAAVPVKPNDSLETLHERIQAQEHRLVVETLWKLKTNTAIVRNNRVQWE